MANQYAGSPLIAVIVAVFNGGRTLQRCIDSVAKQSYFRKSLIVIDGGSTDGSVEIIKANRGAIEEWLSEPDRGIYHAWNKGITRAKGDWICFLGADDRLHDPKVLEAMSVVLASATPRHRLVYGRVIMVDANGSEVDCLGLPWERARGPFMQGTYCLPTPGTMHHRSLFEQHGQFDESYSIAGDYEFLLRELKTRAPLYVPEIVVSDMQHGGISSRPESTIISLREMKVARVKHALPAFNMGYLAGLLRLYMRLALWRVFGEKAARNSLDWGRRLLGKRSYWTKT